MKENKHKEPYKKAKFFIIQNVFFYIAGFVIILGIKYFYSKADSNDLEWILAPTARWVRILSGIPFKNEPHVGYVNHSFRFIIAASCSGIQFMIITISTLIFSFIHHRKTIRGKLGWTAFSLGFSYLFTIFINGFRIVIAIYLPFYLHKTGIYSEWLTPERLHTIIGIAVYFTSLFILYHVTGYVSEKLAAIPEVNVGCTGSDPPDPAYSQAIREYMPPLFWYFFIALGIPFLNHACQNDRNTFTEYAALIVGVCMIIVTLFYLISITRKFFNKHKYL